MRAAHGACPRCHFVPKSDDELFSQNQTKKREIASDYCLSGMFPDIASEWEYDKNEGLSPDVVSPLSRDSVWWKCEKGHVWKEKIRTRTETLNSCPYCSGARTPNTLSMVYPHLVDYLHPTKNEGIDPDNIAVGSKKKLWWTCAHGHEYETTIKTRAKSNHVCPVCAGQRIINGINSLQSQRPDIAALWNYELNGELTPDLVSVNSPRPVWWHCDDCNSDYHKPPKDICRNESVRCPYCANKKVMTGVNDLATKSPRLALEWDYAKNDKTPDEVLYCSNTSVWWKCCECGRSWTATPRERYNNDSYCRSCGMVERRVAFIKESRQNERPSYIEYYEEHIDLMKEEVDASALKIILKALQVDEQILEKWHIFYQKPFSEIAYLLEVSEEYIKTVYTLLGLPECNDFNIKKEQELVNKNRQLEENGISPEWLIEQKILKRRTSKDISDETGVSKSAIDKMSARLGIGKRRNPHTIDRFGHSRQWFFVEHVDKQRSYTDLANELGVDNNVIERLFRDLDIPYLGACRDCM